MEPEDITIQFNKINNNTDNIYVLLSNLEDMIPQHTHKQGHILLVLDGVANVDIEQNTYFIPQGYFAWIPEKISHRISFDSPKITLLNIYFPNHRCTDDFYKHQGVYNTPSLLYHTFEIIKSQSKAYTPTDWQFRLLSTMKSILPNIIKSNIFSLRLPNSNHPKTQKIINFIHLNYSHKITLQQVANETGMSTKTLNRHLRDELDISFTQYLRIFRIVMAIKLLKKDESSISITAYAVGYESLTAFSNTFFNITGYRPSQFLKLMQ